MHQVIQGCRSCSSAELLDVLSLPDMPPADQLLTAEQLAGPEPVFPLTLAFCARCSLVQLRETVSPDVLFGADYPYFSSVSEGWLRHCRENALELIATRNLDAGSLVVELASNDGYLLRNFLDRRIPVLGIDPTRGPVEAARALGIPVIREFFTRDLAATLRAEGRRADVVIANNVLAHVADLAGFVAGIRLLLKEDGVAVIEVPYVRDLIDRCEFDTIYHEHLCYYSATSLSRLFAAHGLSLNGVSRLPTHGGSLRLYVEPRRHVSEAVSRLLAEERELGLGSIGYFQDFASRVLEVQRALIELLAEQKSAGRRLAAYGAAAKGATLLNATRIGTETLDYVIDRNRHKHGKFMPGVHIPIEGPARLLSDPPDAVLLLAWNHRDEIVSQQAEYLEHGGRFIVPIPWPEIL